ncbi:HNH endonuclease [Desertivirga xinjiangensis]|uniref:HNH endonuclease n=1 Tax=Desertivirga xinjiangensis TaxID=539206 RepID=UPI002109EE3F|nr:HNH endonuclease [Pedobacter xinjiangensis]
MPPNISDRIHLFQIIGETFSYTVAKQGFITSLNPLTSADWDKGLEDTGRARGFVTKRNDLKAYIKQQLELIQHPHCIYCGLHKNIVGTLQREHIAPKDLYPEFLFEPENLALACASCNGFQKKNNTNTVSTSNVIYSRCRFTIIHPYRDDYRNHYDMDITGNEIIIKAKKYSRKGKATIKMFGLDEPHQAQMRGASLMQRYVPVDVDLQKLLDAALKKDYY